MGYLGYVLKAGVQGFQTGFNMAQKKTEMEWQKKQKKKLEQKEAELMEASSIFNSMVATAGEDGFYSEDEKLKINTAYMALAYEVKGRVDGTYKAIQAMDQKTTEANYQWFDFLTEGVKGLDAKNVEALFDFVEPNITGEKGLQMFEALENITEKRQGIAQEEQTWRRGATLPADVRTGYLRQEGIEIPEAEPEVKEPNLPGAIKHLKNLPNATPEQFNALKADAERYFNVDLSNVTQESLREPEGEVTPEGKKYRVTSLPTLEKYRVNALNADTLEDMQSIIKDYEEAGYDPAPLTEKANEQEWANTQIEYLSKVKRAIENLLVDRGDKGKWLNNKVLTEEEVGVEFDGERPASEIYEELYKSYTEYLEKLRKMGVDVSQFPELLPLGEIERVSGTEGFFAIHGVKKGDYKSIYK